MKSCLVICCREIEIVIAMENTKDFLSMPNAENGESMGAMDRQSERIDMRDMATRLSALEERLSLVENSLNCRNPPGNVPVNDGLNLTSLVLKAFAAGGSLGTTREWIRFWLETHHGIEDRPKLRRNLNQLLKRLMDEGRVTSCGSVLSLVESVPLGDVKRMESEPEPDDKP